VDGRVFVRWQRAAQRREVAVGLMPEVGEGRRSSGPCTSGQLRPLRRDNQAV
jgi:hypothetical protein